LGSARLVGQPEVIPFHPSRVPLAAILPLFPHRFQLPIDLEPLEITDGESGLVRDAPLEVGTRDAHDDVVRIPFVGVLLAADRFEANVNFDVPAFG
jgi:hypothetical protein